MAFSTVSFFKPTEGAVVKTIAHCGGNARTMYGRRREVIMIKRILFFVLLIFLTLLFVDLIYRRQEYDVKSGYSYPLDMKEFPKFIDKLRSSTMDGKLGPSFPSPINKHYSSIQFLHSPRSNDAEEYGLLIIVKSAIKNHEKRQSVRETWGNASYLNSVKLHGNLSHKIVFICGVSKPNQEDVEKNLAIHTLFPNESKYDDIIIPDFIDTYDNNTYKTMLAFKWAVEEKIKFQHLLLVDDDMYMDLDNLVTYLDKFPNKRFSVRFNEEVGPQFPYYRFTTKTTDAVSGTNILNDGLYMGKVYDATKPIRFSLAMPLSTLYRRWEVSFPQYGYNYYPPYIPGAAILFSETAVQKLYYASSYVRHFFIDDVFLGIIAHKLGIIPVANPHFYAYYPSDDVAMSEDSFSEAISIHGCQCAAQMKDLWLNRNLKKLIDC